MKELIQGIIDFRRTRTKESSELFAKLAIEQKPNALFIACSDSRVVPNLFASTNPGDLFVLRNIGNLIPIDSKALDNSVGAILEYSVMSLNIADIIICGHSECGAMKAITNGSTFDSCPHLTSWLEHGKESLIKIQNGFTLNPSLSLDNQVSQVNVLEQIEHLKSFPFIRERWKLKKLRLHGWWFDIAKADVYFYVPELNKFVQIDETKGKILLDILG